MGDRQQQPPQAQQQRPYDGGGGVSVTKVLAVVTLLPVGGTLLALSGMTLIGTLIVLALATPVFVIFSPVIVPAAAVIGLAVLAFLTSGALGLTGLSSMSCFAGYLRDAAMALPRSLDQVKMSMLEAAGQAGQKARDAAQSKAQEGGR